MVHTRSKLFVLGALVVVLAGVATVDVLDQRAEVDKSKIKVTPSPDQTIPKVSHPHQGSTPGFYPKILVDISFVGESLWAAKLLTDLKAMAALDPTKLKVAWTVPANPAPAEPPGGMYVINDGKELGLVMPTAADLQKVPKGYTGYLTDDFLKHVDGLRNMEKLPWKPGASRLTKPELAGQPQ